MSHPGSVLRWPLGHPVQWSQLSPSRHMFFSYTLLSLLPFPPHFWDLLISLCSLTTAGFYCWVSLPISPALLCALPSTHHTLQAHGVCPLYFVHGVRFVPCSSCPLSLERSSSEFLGQGPLRSQPGHALFPWGMIQHTLRPPQMQILIAQRPPFQLPSLGSLIVCVSLARVKCRRPWPCLIHLCIPSTVPGTSVVLLECWRNKRMLL